ncbi:MAG: hypothetical protein DRP15_03575 [Candidatus Aenigmatarchaeota archaeon]|nr:MAG: hypothetical protein DRP15_03575 [Candidatus Aenigmarchaeota archaeon]
MVVLFQLGSAFPELLRNMEDLGFFLYLFPFLLALAIIYGVLTWALKDQLPKSARGLISIIFAFFVMLYSSWNEYIVTFFANLGGSGLIVGSGILFIVILLGLIGFDIKSLTGEKAGTSKWIFIFAIIIIGLLIFFGAGAGWLIEVPPWSTTSEFWTVIFFIFILALVMWWMGQGEGGGGGGGS